MKATLPLTPMTVAGIMSGTSGDGIDVALVRITPPRASVTATGTEGLKLKLLAHAAFPFPRALRAAVLASMDAQATSTAELARLNWRLGIAYAEAVRATLGQHATGRTRLDLIGCHGQTIYHQGKPAVYAGRSFNCTWQIGEPALLAHALNVPVVSNFRPADMAAGGQGAPLVPLLDYTLFRHSTRARVLQNIGGIGNLTVIPAGGKIDSVRAFDTGPGNMVMDALVQKLFAKPFDRGGRIAARGQVLTPVLEKMLRLPFFRATPPKSAGREQFGIAFVESFLAAAKEYSRRPEDAVATATALTAHSIAQAYEHFVQPILTDSPGSSTKVDMLVSGGGAKNATLLLMLSRLLPSHTRLGTTGDAALPVEAKEAAAFALLAYQTWHHRTGNVPSATGASRPAILGQISYV